MKITGLDLHGVRTPRRYGTVCAADGGGADVTVEESYHYVLELHTDTGLTGLGEISDVEMVPNYTPDDVPPREVLEETLRWWLTGRDPRRRESLYLERPFRGLVAAAVDMAIHDLLGQAWGVPVYDLLGGLTNPSPLICWVVFIRDDLALLREEIAEQLAAGFRAFKLKVGVDAELDDARLAVVREIVGPQAEIKIDASGAWSVDEAIATIGRLSRHNLAGVETPVPRGHVEELAAVRRAVTVPILEHANDFELALAMIRADAVDVINTYVGGMGGLYPLQKMLALCEAAQVGVLLGSTLELGIGTAAQLHAAVSTSTLCMSSDLIGPAMYTADVIAEPFVYADSSLRLPTAPGLGVRLDRQRLEELRWDPA
ncbi:MAG: mandelate racemase/muconate lactonizing enzyme family protein [Armatimonadetes bacterium]|nr:mandelate racemase/muconate lactonizing enzyme family protein [Armatimonadota bacterium]